MKFRKKPVEVEAVQWTGKNVGEIKSFAGLDVSVQYYDLPPTLRIYTLEGVMTAKPGDWIIKGVQGELYPCKPDVFEKTYEPIITEEQAYGNDCPNGSCDAYMTMTFEGAPALVFVQEKVGGICRIYQDGKELKGVRRITIDACAGEQTTHTVEYLTGHTE